MEHLITEQIFKCACAIVYKNMVLRILILLIIFFQLVRIQNACTSKLASLSLCAVPRMQVKSRAYFGLYKSEYETDIELHTDSVFAVYQSLYFD